MSIITEIEKEPKVLKEIQNYFEGVPSVLTERASSAADLLEEPVVRGGLTRVVLGRIEKQDKIGGFGKLSGRYYPGGEVDVLVSDHEEPEGVYAESVPF